MAFEQARQYLARVVPWDGKHFISIHHKLTLPDGRKVFPGKPCLGMDAAVNTLEFFTQAGRLADLYVSMASQRGTTPKQGAKGVYQAANRTIENAAYYKSLFMDLDVKEGGYASQAEAKARFREFLVWSRMPPPTVIVSSGTGGLHIYWTAVEAFPQSTWNRLSGALVTLGLQFGLHFDSQCTVDPVRLLRPPNTYNLKQTNPLPVELIYASPSDLFIEKLEAALAPYVGAQAVTLGSKAPPPVPAGEDDIAAGIVRNTLPPSDIDQVASVCPFIAEELASGGLGTPQPLWFLTLRLASCCVDPVATAHRLSSGHHSYSAEETEDMLARLLEEKAAKPSLGPPRCIKLQQAGSKQCAACPMLTLGKSPLNVPGAFASFTPTTPNLTSGPSGLPQGYFRGTDQLIYMTDTNDDGTANSILVFPYQVITPWCEGGREYALNFTTFEEGTEYKHVRIPFSGLADKSTTAKSLAGEGLPLKVTDRVQDFMTSFQKLLRDTPGSIIRCDPVGWYVSKGETVGFAYDGICYTKQGDQIAQSMEPALRAYYTPTGDGGTWLEAVRIINSQRRPALDALLLSAFASPLISFAGQTGVSLGGWSNESGVGKTTALQIAQAVWGHPVKASGGLNDTANATFRRAGLTRNLPLIWDEIKTSKQTTTFVETIFTMTSGREKARLNRSARQAHQGEWQAILAYASNSSMSDAIIEQTKSTTAGHVRIFEFKVPPAIRNMELVSKMSALMDRLRSNYGHAGLIYAKFLGQNHDTIHAKVKAIQVKLEDELRAREDERFWIALMAATLAAAVFANNLGLTTVDIPGLKTWLIKEFNRMRGHKDLAPNDFSKADNIIHTLAKFLAEKRSHNTITTDTIPLSRGKPPAGSIRIINDGPSTDRLGTLQVQISQNPKLIRLADSALGEWCIVNNIPKTAMTDGLKEKLSARYANVRLGSGTRVSGITEPVWELAVAGTALDQEVDW